MHDITPTLNGPHDEQVEQVRTRSGRGDPTPTQRPADITFQREAMKRRGVPMSTMVTNRVTVLNETYTDAVNRAVAEDRMDLVAALQQEFDQCLDQLQAAS